MCLERDWTFYSAGSVMVTVMAKFFPVSCPCQPSSLHALTSPASNDSPTSRRIPVRLRLSRAVSGGTSEGEQVRRWGPGVCCR